MVSDAVGCERRLAAAGEARHRDHAPLHTGQSEARFAMRARVGPIFPAAPRKMMSPGSRASVSTTPGVGSLSALSSSGSVRNTIQASKQARRSQESSRPNGRLVEDYFFWIGGGDDASFGADSLVVLRPLPPEKPRRGSRSGTTSPPLTVMSALRVAASSLVESMRTLPSNISTAKRSAPASPSAWKFLAEWQIVGLGPDHRVAGLNDRDGVRGAIGNAHE